MNHPDNDTILKYALETLPPAEHAGVREHIETCPECSNALDGITHDIALISGLNPDTGGSMAGMPVTRRAGLIPVFRAAAILIAGFLAGYYASEISRPAPVTIVQQRLEPVPATVAANTFTTCDVIDIATD